ncbi:hypothetical protein IKF57_00735 [Candidatus Saccharibacteria bacterium]|nr:hypothetical protein [Candidatus Saccharibacteria bacterium]
MNTKKKKFYDIVGGPNRDAIFDACKYAKDKNVVFPLEFKVSTGYTGHPDEPEAAYVLMKAKNFSIYSIEHEDGSGQSFNLKGHLEIEVYLEHHTVPSWRPRYFEAYYNTKTRKGHICFD